ncbi:MAG: putative hydro-lyase [Pseudomonadota bacterium]
MSVENPALALRKEIRGGAFTGNTSGLAPGYVQCNLMILPADWALDFMGFCQQNPKPCPLVAASAQPGDAHIAALGEDLDIRTDVSGYRVFENGEEVASVDDVSEFWRDDLVVFAIGCSFSFEEALLADGLEIRNITEGLNVPMYDTGIPCAPSGRLSGNMVVSMRPFLAADAIRAIQICTRFPSVHGAPVHIGDPAQIGIADIARPEYGDAVSIKDGELPVFWGCGVTPQAVVAASRPPFCITHAPGKMLVTDLLNSKLAVL